MLYSGFFCSLSVHATVKELKFAKVSTRLLSVKRISPLKIVILCSRMSTGIGIENKEFFKNISGSDRDQARRQNLIDCSLGHANPSKML